MRESLLFWPVSFKAGVIHILDETKLPAKITYIKVKNTREAVRAIRQMKTRAFGQFLVVLYSFMQVIEQNKGAAAETLLKKIKYAAAALNHSRPTFPFKEVTSIVVHRAEEFARNKQDISPNLRRNIEGHLTGIRFKRLERCCKIAALIKNGDAVLTHCNVSGELAMAAQLCRENKKFVSFYATETRPYLQGARLTAWELKHAGFPITLICDNAVGRLMREGKVDKVIVGSDRSCANGDIANKIGTYQMAVLAREFKVPFYVLSQPSKQTPCGKEIPIEMRSENELLSFNGKRIVPSGTRGLYPAFDVTPAKLITGTVTIDVQ